jgi:hypothetical protein
MSTISTSPLFPDRETSEPSGLAGSRAALIFAALTAALTWPQIAHPLSVPIHDDAYFSMWRLAWIAHQLPRSPWHLFDANTLYPARTTLAYSDAVLLQGLAGAPFIWLGAPVVLVYNAEILATFVLCGLGLFLLVRDLTGSAAAGLVAGIVFAFATYRFDHYPHLELLSAQWMPFSLWMLHRTLRSGRFKDGLWTGAFASLQGLSCVYLVVFFATISAVLVPLLFLWSPADDRRRAVLPLCAGALLMSVVLGCYLIPYRAAHTVVGERSVGEQMLYAAGPKHYIAAMPGSLLYGRLTGSIGLHEKRLFTGFVAMLLAMVALWPPFDRHRLAYAIALILAVDVSFGHRGLVGALLQNHIAVYRGLRVVARIGAVVLMLCAVLAGFGAARLFSALREGSAKLAAIGISLLILAECLVRPLTLGAVEIQPGEAYRWLQQQPRGVIAEMPMPASWKSAAEIGMHESRFTYNSTFTWNPMVNGYSGFWPPSYTSLIEQVRQFPAADAMRALKQRGVQYLIVHEKFYGRERYRLVIDALDRCPGVVRFGPFAEQQFEVRVYRIQ